MILSSFNQGGQLPGRPGYLNKETKKCSKCKKIQPYTEFCKHRQSGDGYDWWCKTCKRKYQIRIKEKRSQYLKNYREKNRSKIKKYLKQWSKNNQKRKALINIKYRQNGKGKASQARINHRQRSVINSSFHNLTLKEWNLILINQNYKCAICKKQFSEKLKPVRDCITPLSSDGKLTFNNVQALCKSCNSIKGESIV